MLYLLAGIVSVLFLVADQITKWYIASNFILTETRPFINGFIDFTYINNKGGAWGLMDGHTWILLSLTFFIMIICVALLIKEGFKIGFRYFFVIVSFFALKYIIKLVHCFKRTQIICIYYIMYTYIIIRIKIIAITQILGPINQIPFLNTA